MIARTFEAVWGRTPGSSLTTRETVLIDTSARRATSAIVGRTARGYGDAAVADPFDDNVDTAVTLP
ncbi:hypothetical protein GCM10009814_20440 [Lapillicoccus jejuensis]